MLCVTYISSPDEPSLRLQTEYLTDSVSKHRLIADMRLVINLLSKVLSLTIFLVVLAGSEGNPALAAQEQSASQSVQTASQYFPLALGRKWVLTHPIYNAQFTFEVVAQAGSVYRVRCTTPWSTSDWELTDQGGGYAMTGYGNTDGLMPLGTGIVFLDFSSTVGAAWTNLLGQLSVDSRSALFVGGGATFNNCIRIRQVNQGTTTQMTFAPGVGIVEYAMGDQVFLLDTQASNLPPNAFSSPGTATATSTTLPPVGVISNGFGDQPDTLLAATDRLQLMASGGSRVLVGYGRWNELEPVPGIFQLDTLRLQISQAKRLNLSAALTFCIIDMAARNLPGDLASLPWSDPSLQQRVLQLVATIAGEFGGQVKWFQFGSEVDSYFQWHPDEVDDFLQLYRRVRLLLRQLAPGMQVSVNFKEASLPFLNGYLAPLYNESDLLVLTYGPYTDNFVVSPPSVVSTDFQAMLQAAGSRQLFLQEIAYPSSTANGSSADMQAQFYTNIFSELRAAAPQIAAASIFQFGDFGPGDAVNLAANLGMAQYQGFVAMIQSLGMFDSSGQPKMSWHVFTTEANH
jgi:hypothetical protein